MIPASEQSVYITEVNGGTGEVVTPEEKVGSNGVYPADGRPSATSTTTCSRTRSAGTSVRSVVRHRRLLRRPALRDGVSELACTWRGSRASARADDERRVLEPSGELRLSGGSCGADM